MCLCRNKNEILAYSRVIYLKCTRTRTRHGRNMQLICDCEIKACSPATSRLRSNVRRWLKSATTSPYLPYNGPLRCPFDILISRHTYKSNQFSAKCAFLPVRTRLLTPRTLHKATSIRTFADKHSKSESLGVSASDESALFYGLTSRIPQIE